MKRKVMFGILAVSLLCGAAANAVGTWKTRSYDATYSYNGGTAGSGTYRMAGDGKGHMLMETHVGQTNSTMIMDTPNKVTYAINSMPNGQKMIMKMPYKDDGVSGTTAEEMKKYNAKPLGIKVVAGHPAHGYQYVVPGTNCTTEAWIGDDIDFMVASQSNNPQVGLTKMELKSFSPKAPPDSAFQLPAGGKVMDMSNIQKMYGGGGQ